MNLKEEVIKKEECDKMKYPKVIFKPISIEDNIDLVKWAYYEENEMVDIHHYILDYFPSLKVIPQELSKKQKDQIIEEIIKKEHQQYYQRIMEEVKHYNRIWEQYNDRYIKELESYLEIAFPSDLYEINAYVGLTPTYPRDLKTMSFIVGTGVKEEDVIRITAHEVCHFLWFMKWKKLYPDCSLKEYDSPYLPWQYSEMVVDPILNSEKIKRVIQIEEKAYDNFYQLNDENGYNVMRHLNKIYSSNMHIDEKIKKGYEYISSVLK